MIKQALGWVVGIACILGLLMVPGELLGQAATGRIYGTVMDPSQGVIPGATVVIQNLETGVKRVVITNDDGTYNAPTLPPGTYSVSVEQTGFKKYERSGLVLGASQVLQLNVQLEIGETSQVISVTGDLPLINTSEGATRTELNTDLIKMIPLNGRDSNTLLAMAPGAISEYQGGAVSMRYSVNGMRATSNNFTLDGSDNHDSYNNTMNRLPPPDALKEFTIRTNYSAEFGGAGGAAIIAVTRSGTNRLHGTLYDYFRAENLNANTFQRNSLGRTKGDFKRHQFGYSVGGPIYLPKVYDGRNRSFFFFSHEEYLTPSTPFLTRQGGLTAAELAGDFSNSVIQPVVSASAAGAKNSPFAGMAGQTITNLAPYLSPAAVKWYNLFNFPIAAQSGSYTYTPGTQSLSQRDITMRLDHMLRENHTVGFSAQYRLNAPELTQASDAPLGFMSSSEFKSQHYSLSYVWTINPRLLNEVILGYNRIWESRLGSVGSYDYDALGLAYPRTDPAALISFDSLAPSAYMQIPGSTPRYEGRDLFDLRESVSWTRGNHFFKFGADGQRLNVMFRLAQSPNFAYGTNWLKNAAAEFLIGWPNNFSYNQNLYRPVRQQLYSLFAQDDWKVSPRVTLNWGVRYQPHYWAYLTNNLSYIFIPGATSVSYPNFKPGYVDVLDPASPGRSGKRDDLNNVAPRLGMAYRLDSAGDMSLHGGWGIFYDSWDTTRDGMGLARGFPFVHSYSMTFDRGYPVNDSWLDIFGYAGIPRPDLNSPIDPGTSIWDPKTSYGGINPDGSGGAMTMGYIQQWNITFEHAFRKGWSYSAAYVGNHGTDLEMPGWFNLPVRVDSTDSWNQENMASRTPLQEYKYDTMSYMGSGGKSEFHGAQFELKARTSRFNFISHYTLGRAYAYTSGIFRDSNPGHPVPDSSDWGRAYYHRTHNLLLLPSYDLPFFDGRHDLAGKLLGGWNTTFIINLQAGIPINMTANVNNTYTCSGCAVRPDQLSTDFYMADWRSDPGLTYLNQSAFGQPAPGEFGNMKKSVVNWPAQKNVDMSVAKRFGLYREDVQFELKFDFFNLFNMVNWNIPGSNQIRAQSNPIVYSMKNYWTTPSREIQIGGRITF
jgi:hypothetical protein